MNKNVYKQEIADLLMNFLISRHSFSFITEWLGRNYLRNEDTLSLSKNPSADSSAKAEVKEIRQLSDESPGHCSLYQNSPNPFSEKTIINFQCSCNSFVSLKIYDITWKEISTLVYKKTVPGTYQIEFDGSSLTKGIYFCRMDLGNFSDTIKMLIER